MIFNDAVNFLFMVCCPVLKKLLFHRKQGSLFLIQKSRKYMEYVYIYTYVYVYIYIYIYVNIYIHICTLLVLLYGLLLDCYWNQPTMATLNRQSVCLFVLGANRTRLALYTFLSVPKPVDTKIPEQIMWCG